MPSIAEIAGAAVSASSDLAPVGDQEKAEGEAADAEGGRQGAPGELTEAELEKWKADFAEARANLQNAVNEALVLQLRMNTLNNAFLSRSDGVTQERIQAQLQETFDQIERNKRDQRDARARVATLQREARAAGLTRAQIDEFTGTLPGEPPEIFSAETGNPGSD